MICPRRVLAHVQPELVFPASLLRVPAAPERPKAPGRVVQAAVHVPLVQVVIRGFRVRARHTGSQRRAKPRRDGCASHRSQQATSREVNHPERCRTRHAISRAGRVPRSSAGRAPRQRKKGRRDLRRPRSANEERVPESVTDNSVRHTPSRTAQSQNRPPFHRRSCPLDSRTS